MSEGIAGRWDLVVGEGDQAFPSWVELQNGIGSFVGKVGSARPVPRIAIDGDVVRFGLPRQYESRTSELEFEGRLVGDRLVGTCLGDDGTTLPWSGIRAPGLKREKLPVWGEPTELVGKDMSGWTLRSPEWVGHWSIASDGLVNADSGSDIVSVAKFNDFRLTAEYNYPKGSNSGIYLRGRYEFQILDDHGSAPHVGSSGAIYGFLAPSENAIKPAGEWQLAVITLIGRTVTVELNGVTIIDDREIPGITGGALDSQEGAPGPLFLQGDHGPVTFRRLSIQQPV